MSNNLKNDQNSWFKQFEEAIKTSQLLKSKMMIKTKNMWMAKSDVDFLKSKALIKPGLSFRVIWCGLTEEFRTYVRDDINFLQVIGFSIDIKADKFDVEVNYVGCLAGDEDAEKLVKNIFQYQYGYNMEEGGEDVIDVGQLVSPTIHPALLIAKDSTPTCEMLYDRLLPKHICVDLFSGIDFNYLDHSMWTFHSLGAEHHDKYRKYFNSDLSIEVDLLISKNTGADQLFFLSVVEKLKDEYVDIKRRNLYVYKLENKKEFISSPTLDTIEKGEFTFSYFLSKCEGKIVLEEVVDYPRTITTRREFISKLDAFEEAKIYKLLNPVVKGKREKIEEKHSDLLDLQSLSF